MSKSKKGKANAMANSQKTKADTSAKAQNRIYFEGIGLPKNFYVGCSIEDFADRYCSREPFNPKEYTNRFWNAIVRSKELREFLDKANR